MQAAVAAQPRVGDEVNVIGRVVESYEWLYKGVPMQRLTLSHPTIDGVPVHAAYLTACKGLEEQCAAIKYRAVSTDGVALVSDISAYGEITTINVTQYYSDYYLDATSDISN